MTDLKSIKDKISKLLAKAEGSDNVHEQDAFMNAVQRLLEEHEIELHEIRLHGGVDMDTLGATDGEYNVYASIGGWAKLCIHYIAKYYGCTTVWQREKNHMPYKVFGRESNRLTTELMVPWIMSQVKMQAKAYADDTGRTIAVAQRNVGMALASRISKMIVSQESHRKDLQRNALVPVDSLDQFVEDFYNGKLKVGRASKKGYSATASDYAAKVSLNRQTTSGGAGRKQIAAG